MIKMISYRLFRRLTLLLLVAYVGCCLTNILVLPNISSTTDNVETADAPGFKKHSLRTGDQRRLTLVRLIDRSVVNEFHFLQKPAFLLLLFAFTGLLCSGKALSEAPPLSYLFYNKQYSYLTFRTLRV